MLSKKLCVFIVLLLASTTLVNCGGFEAPSGNRDNTPADEGGDSGLPTKCGSSVVLSWTNPTRNVDGSDLTNLAGIRLYYGNTSRNYGVMIEHTNTAVTTRTITDLAPGPYYFAATAFNTENDESSYTGEVAIELLACMVAFVNVQNGQISYSPLADQ